MNSLFWLNVQSATTQVVILYLLVFVGFVLNKAKLFSASTAGHLIDMVLYVVTPCVLIDSFLKMEPTPAHIRSFFLSFGLMALTHLIAIGLSMPFFRRQDSLNPIFKYASIYGNVGFMALPLAQAILGAEGVFYCANGYIVFNVITFIHGIKLMAGRHYHMDWRKLVFNPGVISVLIGLPLFLLHVQLPTVLAKPIEYLGNLNAPLGMLIFGAYLARTDLKTLFREKRVYLVALLKLVVLPGVCICLYRLVGVRGVLLVACCITACVPSGNNTFMFASKFHKDVGVGSKTVALVSAFSLITMPLMIAAAQAMQ